MSVHEGGWLSIVLVSFLIFLARVCDVTLGTLRIVFISRGEKYIAPMFALFEMMIWLFAIRQIMLNLGNITYYFAYAAGFATGVFVGLNVEERIAMGIRLIRTITRKDAGELLAALTGAGFGATSVSAEGATGSVNVVYSVVRRRELDRYIALVREFNPNAFYSIEDIRFVSPGTFPSRRRVFSGRVLGLFRSWGKAK